jgi:hypothetical protein
MSELDAVKKNHQFFLICRSLQSNRYKNSFARLRCCHTAKQLQRFGSVSKKIDGDRGRNNSFDEVRRVKSKMYPPEIMGAGAARFEFDNDGRLDIFLVTMGRSTAKWNGSAMSRQAAA